MDKSRKNYGTVLFDLDGTLTDPEEGITKSVAYALAHFGIKVDDLGTLRRFIGPPLAFSFMTYYGFSREDARVAVEKYRENFSAKGIYQNLLYKGMDSLLQGLADDGKTLIVATSKPTEYAIKILCGFDLKKYFSLVVGADFDGIRSEKIDIIRAALSEGGVINKSDCVMIGDREYDIKGASANGIDSVGVLYGFGSLEELTSAGATYIAADIPGLQSLLLG